MLIAPRDEPDEQCPFLALIALTYLLLLESRSTVHAPLLFSPEVQPDIDPDIDPDNQHDLRQKFLKRSATGNTLPRVVGPSTGSLTGAETGPDRMVSIVIDHSYTNKINHSSEGYATLHFAGTLSDGSFRADIVLHKNAGGELVTAAHGVDYIVAASRQGIPLVERKGCRQKVFKYLNTSLTKELMGPTTAKSMIHGTWMRDLTIWARSAHRLSVHIDERFATCSLT